MLGKLWYRQYALLVFNLALCIMCRTRSRHDKRIAILAVSRFLGYLCWLSLVEIQSNISSRNLFHQRYLCLQFKFNGKFELLWWKATRSPHICAHFMAAQLSCVEIYTENCIKLKWYQNELATLAFGTHCTTYLSLLIQNEEKLLFFNSLLSDCVTCCTDIVSVTHFIRICQTK